ncbi:hypothetical protein [Planctomycetes bacterium Pan216]
MNEIPAIWMLHHHDAPQALTQLCEYLFTSRTGELGAKLIFLATQKERLAGPVDHAAKVFQGVLRGIYGVCKNPKSGDDVAIFFLNQGIWVTMLQQTSLEHKWKLIRWWILQETDIDIGEKTSEWFEEVKSRPLKFD